MSIESLTQGVRDSVGEDSGLGATVKFDLGDDGKIFVDGASSPNTVSNDDADAQCTIKISMENFEKMAAGDLDPTAAFMSGKLSVSGDMSIAMKLGTVLG